MTITLITGSNTGLGFEAARRLVALGHTVYLTARDAEKGRVAAAALGARFVQLDVTDHASVTRAAAELQRLEGKLDVLINNAGIAGPDTSPAEVTAAEARTVFDTNVFGAMRVTQAMLPLLNESTAPVIVNVSSGLGSFGIVTDSARMESRYPSLSYSASKAAISMLTVQYAKAFPGLRVNAVDPGYTSTALNGHNGTQTVTEGTDAMVRLATISRDGPTGTFHDASGPIPW
ncbi:SDR family oxidoreductase [Cryobacterium sp. TMT2-15-1]|uniref:SDR family oxidoreductase n=1 Tax=Cryobacterium sp. TMT2-15-1 TaxID=1259246 RepID=UPI001068FD1A|nr:SDR family oxidoreductase [Cryobacterium sp. TMT2-15-1]TFC61191.1 SDR family oxidoreductase [Cryobacterium sp. TMT2-15-1]